MSSEASLFVAYVEVDRQKAAASALFSGMLELGTQLLTDVFNPSTSSDSVGSTEKGASLMTFHDLKIRTSKNEKIPKGSYSFTVELPNEALCIFRHGEEWEVYYSERGKKTNLMIFKTESEACEYFYKHLLKMIE